MIQTRKAIQSKLEIPIVLLLALILAACASAGGEDKKKSESLQAAVDAFNSALKWEDYSTAVGYVPAGQKDQFWAEADKLKGKVRIVEYQIREVDHVEMNRSGNATLYFQYWRTDAPTLQTVTLHQLWYYLEKDKTWKVRDTGLGSLTKTRAAM